MVKTYKSQSKPVAMAKQKPFIQSSWKGVDYIRSDIAVNTGLVVAVRKVPG